MTDEIKAVARRRLAMNGVADLSLRGVARDLDIVASALYRYFPSRDALLTALLVDAYQELAEAAADAEAAIPRDDLRGRWLAIGRAVRTWALANPAEYGLLYGNPIPGYAAPQDTVEPASQVILLMVTILRDAATQGTLTPIPRTELPDPVRADLRRLIDQRAEDLPPELLDSALTGWSHLFGLVSFEVFGRLNDMITARPDYLDHQMTLIADLAGLPPAELEG
ncbi:TetR family transcriptional regulator [Kribbella sp. VKM Ac-2527]|uniref:TetR family transcriptional regulator n=2 Tax=Kribbella caucasensis TaxID=2512215 RepID=A0A4R6K244_9ACTN|nr:TetR family transcriptional regulator [Kribbella sp. VKM Ac-2527]